MNFGKIKKVFGTINTQGSKVLNECKSKLKDVKTDELKEKGTNFLKSTKTTLVNLRESDKAKEIINKTKQKVDSLNMKELGEKFDIKLKEPTEKKKIEVKDED